MNDIIFFIKKARKSNYANDTSSYATEYNIEELLEIFEMETSEILHWFKVNAMKFNDDKCHLFVTNDDKCHLFVTNEENVLINIGNEPVESDTQNMGTSANKY